MLGRLLNARYAEIWRLRPAHWTMLAQAIATRRRVSDGATKRGGTRSCEAADVNDSEVLCRGTIGSGQTHCWAEDGYLQ